MRSRNSRLGSKQHEGYVCKSLRVKEKSGAPGGTRTPDLLVRSQTLYPTELRARSKEILSQPCAAHPAAAAEIKLHDCRHKSRCVGWLAWKKPHLGDVFTPGWLLFSDKTLAVSLRANQKQQRKRQYRHNFKTSNRPLITEPVTEGKFDRVRRRRQQNPQLVRQPRHQPARRVGRQLIQVHWNHTPGSL